MICRKWVSPSNLACDCVIDWAGSAAMRRSGETMVSVSKITKVESSGQCRRVFVFVVFVVVLEVVKWCICHH